MPPELQPPSGVRLSDFIRDRQADILAAWERLIRAEPVSAELPEAVLRDHLPRLLARLAAAVENGGEAAFDELAELHALDRLDLGYDLRELVTEYKLLRACVLRLYATEVHAIGALDELERFHASLDDAIRVSVARYGTARGRTLLAFDRLSRAAAVGEPSRLLPELLRIVVETVEAVDMGAIFLLEDGRLRVTAAVGMTEDFLRLELAIGEGFAGRIAAERRPLALRDAGRSVRVRPRALPPGTKALYGVPLEDGEKLIGVAYLGSRTTNEFAAADAVLLRAMAARATAFIVQATLREAEAVERRRADAQARLLDAVLRELPVGVAVAEAPSGRILVSNAALEKVAGSPAGELGSGPPGFWPDGRPLAAGDWPLVRALRSGERVEGAEIAILRRDGTRAITVQSAAPVRDDDGAIAAAVLACVDITDRKAIEERLSASAEFRESFIGILSHDLRNLVATIGGTAHVLRARAALDAPTSELVARIIRTSDRMARMIRDLLDFTRGRLGGGIPVTPQPVDLGEVCRHVVDELRAAHPDRELRLELTGDLSAELDPDRIAQAIANLSKNALDYGSPGEPIEVRAAGGAAGVELSVTNAGDPISEEALATLFDPYRRATVRRQGAGLGLGLYIVREIAHAHGGSVEVRSADGRVVFSLRLPRRPPAS